MNIKCFHLLARPTIRIATSCGTEIQNLATNGRTQSRRTAPRIPDSESHLCPAQVEVTASQQQHARFFSRLHIADQLVDRRIVSLELKYLANEVSIHSDNTFFGFPCRLKSQSLHLHSDLLEGQYQDSRAFPSYGHLGIVRMCLSWRIRTFFNSFLTSKLFARSHRLSVSPSHRRSRPAIRCFIHFTLHVQGYIRSHANRMSSRTRNDESFDEGKVQHRPTPAHDASPSQVRCSM